MHVLVNGLAMGSGGGFTVGRMIYTFLAEARPDWKVSILVIEDFKLHQEINQIERPPNTEIIWAPADTIDNLKRDQFEKSQLNRIIKEHKIDWVFQTNGMLVPGLSVPSFCHFQDPWPYRPEAWEGKLDFIKAWLKRRRHTTSLKNCALTGWTSQYLYDLTTGRQGIKPKHSIILYNGVPDDWFQIKDSIKPWNDRPNLIVTISNVSPYKRQSLIIDAVAELVKQDKYKDLEYRVAGSIEPGYEPILQAQIDRLNLKNHVFLEGRVSDDRVKELFANAKVFSLMSVCESFGIPAIEAMTFGTPAVVADCCAIPEVCGKAGTLVEMDSLPDLVTKLDQVLSNPDKVSEIQQLGFENIHRFKWTEIAEKIATAIENHKS